MLVYNIFAQYGLTVTMGIVCIALILVQGKSIIKENKTYKFTALLLGIITLSSAISFYLYINDFVFADFTTPLLMRCVLFALYTMTLFVWMIILQSLCAESGDIEPAGIFNTGKIISLVGTGIFLFIAIFLMDRYSDIKNSFWENAYIYAEQIFAAAAIIIVLLAAVKSLRLIVLSSTKNFVKAATVLLSLDYLCTIIIMTPFGYNMTMDRIDFEGWISLMLNLVILWFIYKEDFQKPFSSGFAKAAMVSEDSEATVEFTPSMAMDILAEDHKLTNREREIFEKVYSGASNAQIAEELFISKNTVKTHMRNIFEKLDVSSRMEIVYMIDVQLHK